VPAGSYLAMSHPTTEVHREAVERATAMWNSSGAAPMTTRDPAHLTRFFAGLEVLEPGLAACSRWRPNGNDTTMVTEFGAVARKP
jgi:hypothetical protein